MGLVKTNSKELFHTILEYISGKNTRGQLGLNDANNKMYPTQLRTLRNIRARYIACGEEFSMFLTMDGGVFTCGAGMFGQLGHGSNSNEILPRQVSIIIDIILLMHEIFPYFPCFSININIF